MVEWNKILQKAEKGFDTDFFPVKYAPSGTISTLVIEWVNAGLLILQLSNLPIHTVKTVNWAFIRVEILEY